MSSRKSHKFPRRRFPPVMRPWVEVLEDRTLLSRYVVTDLGDLGGSYSQAWGINDKGQVVGEALTTEGLFDAFLYQDGQMTDLGTLGGTVATAYAINNAGQVVGESDTTGAAALHPFLYQNGAMIDLGTLGGSVATAYGINDAEQIVGVSDTSGQPYRAFLWQNGGMTDLGTLGGANSEAFAINNAGQIVGQSDTNGDVNARNSHAFLYQDGIMTDLGTLGPRSINNSGQVVGGFPSSSNQTSAFLYENGDIIDLGNLGGASATAQSINNEGQVVGGAMTSGAPNFEAGAHAVLWQDGHITDLNDLTDGTGWFLKDAAAINDSGQIAGWGINPEGLKHAFLLTPNPYVWTGAGKDDLWSNGDNWLGGQAPILHSNLIFPGDAARQSNLDNLDLPFTSVTVEGGTYEFSGESVDITGSLTLKSGTLTVDNRVIVQRDATLDVFGAMTIGTTGSVRDEGKVNVQDGGTLDIKGDFTVTRDGELTAEDGSKVQVDDSGILDDEGQVTVTAKGNLFDHGLVKIEEGADLGDGGTMTVLGQLLVDGTLSVDSGASLTVGNRGLPDDVPNLTIGSSGIVENFELLTVSAGASVLDKGHLTVATDAKLFDEGGLTLQGNVPLAVLGQLSVTDGGKLIVQDGGLLLVGANGSLEDKAGLTGDLNVSTLSTLDVEGKLIVGAATTFEDQGDLTVGENATLTVDQSRLDVDGNLTVVGAHPIPPESDSLAKKASESAEVISHTIDKLAESVARGVSEEERNTAIRQGAEKLASWAKGVAAGAFAANYIIDLQLIANAYRQNDEDTFANEYSNLTRDVCADLAGLAAGEYLGYEAAKIAVPAAIETDGASLVAIPLAELLGDLDGHIAAKLFYDNLLAAKITDLARAKFRKLKNGVTSGASGSGGTLNLVDGGGLTVGPDASLDDQGTINVGATSTLEVLKAGILSVPGKLDIWGTVEIRRGSLFIHPPSTVTVEKGGVLSDQDAIHVAAGATVDDLGRLIEGAGGNLDILGTVNIKPNAGLDDFGTITVEAGALLDVSGTLTVPVHGSLDVFGTVVIEPGATYSPQGKVTIEPGGELRVPSPNRSDAQSAFVTALYRDILNRRPDSSGLSGCVDTLQAGFSRLQVAQWIWESPEHRGLEVDSYYKTYLHRAADPGGRVGWIEAFESGMDEVEVQFWFLASTEYQQAHPSIDAYITALYADVLGRQSDAQGLASWESVAALPFGRFIIALGFLGSTEENLSIVDGFYANFLGRRADAGGEQGWVGALQDGALTVSQVAEDFLGSPEYFERVTA